jgi:ceroid-lipofuscinosis MFS transporter 7
MWPLFSSKLPQQQQHEQHSGPCAAEILAVDMENPAKQDDSQVAQLYVALSDEPGVNLLSSKDEPYVLSVPPVRDDESSDEECCEQDADNADEDPHSQGEIKRVHSGVSTVHSVLTAEGIHDLVGFYCVCMVMLIGDMSRGVMFPSMWPLVQYLGGTEVTLGYAVASFSFGRALVNPVFGFMSTEVGYTKTLLLSSFILLVGTFVYAQVPNLGRPHALIVAQTLLGVGSGTLGVTRAFVADVTAKRHRTRYMGLITAVQYGGFTVTPIFGALFNYLLANVDVSVGPGGFLRWNMYTAPAYFMGSVVLATLIVLSIYFRDRHRIITAKDGGGVSVKRKTSRRIEIDALASTETWLCGLTVYDCCILGCMLLNVSTKGSIASFETLGIAIAQQHFASLTSGKAGAVVAGCGALGVASLLCMGHLEQHFTDVQLINGGMLVMVAGILSLSTVEHVDPERNSAWRYSAAMFLIYSIGYPIGHTAVIGLFSKSTWIVYRFRLLNSIILHSYVWNPSSNATVVGRRPQGTLLGWFASAGSFARMLFPIMSGYIARYRDLETLFFVLTIVLLVSSVVVILCRKTLNLLAT